MANLFTSADRAVLKRPHVGQAYFVDMALPTLGTLRFHNGVGTVTANSQEWRGVSSPDGQQMAQVGAIEEPRFGTAPAVAIVLSGVSADFMSEVKGIAREMEGSAANVHFAVFDAETQDELMFRTLVEGFVSAPQMVWQIDPQGRRARAIVLTIESEEQAKNFSTAERWSPAGIRKRFGANVKGLDFMGVDVKEVRK